MAMDHGCYIKKLALGLFDASRCGFYVSVLWGAGYAAA